MIKLNTKNRHAVRRNISWGIVLAFVVHMGFSPISPAFGQTALPLPAPGTGISLSSAYRPTIMTGIRIYPNNPLKFDFIIDPGDDKFQAQELKSQADKLIKYFLAALTIPEDQMWVNLSPYEKDRIIPEKFGQTEMGRDLLGRIIF